MNICHIITDLARYRKPAVFDAYQTGLLATANNEITEHVDACQDLAIKPFGFVRIGEPMVTDDVLPVILDRGTVFGEVIDTKLRFRFLC